MQCNSRFSSTGTSCENVNPIEWSANLIVLGEIKRANPRSKSEFWLWLNGFLFKFDTICTKFFSKNEIHILESLPAKDVLDEGANVSN